MVEKGRGQLFLQAGQILRVPGQNGISQGCYIVEVYRSAPEPSNYEHSHHFANVKVSGDGVTGDYG